MAAPIRIGILNDLASGPPGPGDTADWLKREVDALVACGRIDRPVEFIHAYGLGLPSGTAAAVEQAYAQLASQDVLCICGPAIGDNALVATPLAERFAIPTLNWAGAERARSEYMFHLQVGSHEDESILLARHFIAAGIDRVAVVYDRSPIGRRHLQYLQEEAEIIGLHIATSLPIAPLAEDADAIAARMLETGAGAMLYLGLGVSALAVARALAARGWSGPCAMNTAGLRGYAPDYARVIDGWTYVDMHSDHNRTLAALRERHDIPPARALAAAKGHDLGRLIAEGLARAPELTREGVRQGLEKIKWLPAAEGEEGTLLGFGPQDRGALHGRYLVLRQWRDGLSVQISAP